MRRMARLVSLGERPGRGSATAALAAVRWATLMCDPLPRPPGFSAYVDFHREEMSFPVLPREGRIRTRVEADRQPYALIEHDAALGAKAVTAACLSNPMGFENERLAAELRAQVRSAEAAEQRLRQVFEAVQLLVVVIDRDGTMSYVNQHLEELSGWSREQLVGRSWYEVFKSGREELLLLMREGQFPTVDRSEIVMRDQTRRQINWFNVAERDAEGRILRIVGLGRDMTEELRATQALEASEQRLRAIFETVQLLVAHIDLDGTLTYVNPHLERISGWSRAELEGRGWYEVFQSGNDYELEDVRAGRVNANNRSEIVLRDGSRRLIDWYNVPLLDARGAIAGVTGIGRDITEEVRDGGRSRRRRSGCAT